MIQIENITDEAHQRHTIIFEESEISLSLRFLSIVSIWAISVEYKTKTVSNFKLSTGVLHFKSENLPFDFAVVDTSGNGLDPFRLDDFSTGRSELYMLEADDMTVVRGVEVEI